jgi:hypothetical protein
VQATADGQASNKFPLFGFGSVLAFLEVHAIFERTICSQEAGGTPRDPLDEYWIVRHGLL